MPADPELDLPIRTASAEELAEELRRASQVVALRGKLTLGLQRSARADTRTCRGVLAARSPWAQAGDPGLYVKGYRSLFPTLFTLVSDGRLFWLHVPSENVVYTGPIAGRRVAGGDGEIPLDARDLFRALFVQPARVDDEIELIEEPSAYVMSFRSEGRVRRRIWIERKRFTVRHEVFYDGMGNAEAAIDRERYVEAGGRLYPGRMLLRDPKTGGAVLLEFDSLTIDPADLNADAFRPQLPPEARTELVPGLEGGS